MHDFGCDCLSACLYAVITLLRVISHSPVLLHSADLLMANKSDLI